MVVAKHFVFYHDAEMLKRSTMGKRYSNIEFVNLNDIDLPKEFIIDGLSERVNKAVFSEYLGIMQIRPTSDLVGCATYSIPIKFSAAWSMESEVEKFLPAIRFEYLEKLHFDENKIYAAELGNPRHLIPQEIDDIHTRFNCSDQVQKGPFKGTFVVRRETFSELQVWLKRVTLYLLENYSLNETTTFSSRFDQSRLSGRTAEQRKVDVLRHKYGTILERALAYFLGAKATQGQIELFGPMIQESKEQSVLIKMARNVAPSKQIAMAFGDSNYSEVIEKWIEKAEAAGVRNYLFIALDEDIHRKISQSGANSVLIPYSGALKDFWIFRSEIIQQLLEAGFDVLHSDADAFWLKNPFETVLENQSDIVASQGTVFPNDIYEKWGFVLCCGFIFFRSNIRVLAFFEQFLELAREVRDDQIALNRTLSDLGISWDDRPHDYELKLEGNPFSCFTSDHNGSSPDGLSVSLLPHKIFQRVFEGIDDDVEVLHLISKKTEGSKLQVLANIENELSNLASKRDVIWLSSFPRSGNTLLRTIFKHNFGLDNFSIYNDKSDIGKFKEIREFVGHQDGEWTVDYQEDFYQEPVGLEKALGESTDRFTLIKTHSQFGEFYKSGKAIYIVRDPRAALRSLVSYKRNFAGDGRTDPEIMAELVHRGYELSGRWSDHVNSWIDNDSENLLILRFEDILNQFDSTLKKISDFIGLKPIKNALADFQKYREVNAKFFRQGKTSDWDDLITPELDQLIWLSSSQNMKRFSYERSHNDKLKADDFPQYNEKADVASWVYICTPTFNSEKTLDATIASILTQEGNFSVHYHIQDGGSTDRTLDIIKKWKSRLSGGGVDVRCRNIELTFDSRPDSGMYQALNRAFESMCPPDFAISSYVNSDDILFPGAIETACQILNTFQNKDWVIPSLYTIGADSNHRGSGSRFVARRFIEKGLCDGEHVPFLQQEGMFWRHTLWRKVGGMNTDFKLAADWDLWRRFAALSEPVYTRYVFGAFRKRAGQLSEDLSKYKDEIDQHCSAGIRKASFDQLKFEMVSKPNVFNCSVLGFDAAAGFRLELIRPSNSPPQRNKESPKIDRALEALPSDDQLSGYSLREHVTQNNKRFEDTGLASLLIDNIRRLKTQGNIDKIRLQEIMKIVGRE